MLKIKKVKKFTYSFHFLLVFTICTLTFVSCMSNARKNYENGVDHYNNGEYLEAKQFFLASGDYGNSKDFLDNIAQYEQLYQEGVQKLEATDYEGAYSIFELIPKYDKSTEYMTQIDELSDKFSEGERLYNENSFIEARELFIAACSYGSSDDYITEIDAMEAMYNEGVELKNAGEFSKAVKAFRSIGTDFNDSEQLITECMAMLESAPIKLSEFINNYNEEYPDGSVSLKTGSTDANFSLVDTQGVIITGTTDENGMIDFMSFSFSDSLVAELGIENYNRAVAIFIHATNPYAMELDDLIENLDSYLRDGQNYGCMHFSIKQANGCSIIEALFNGNTMQ